MSLTWIIIIFLISAVVIAIAGSRLSETADQLADLTGMGEALFGAILLGGTTSLPGIITSVVAAANNHPQLAVSNAIGGIAAQTLFLAIADMMYSKSNLEHAAASFANLMQGLLLVSLLSLVLIGISGPDISLFNVNPVSILLIIGYIAGFMLISRARKKPMWKPEETISTVKDEPEEDNLKNLSLKKTIIKFIIFATIVAAAGYGVGKTGIAIAEMTGLSESFVGALFTAVATSLPELIVSVTAVRRNAVTMAVSNIIGGNTFDVLFIAFADVAYARGSILHAISGDQVFIIALTMLMVTSLILGLLHRERKGIGKIGWESMLIIILYVAGNAFLYFSDG